MPSISDRLDHAQSSIYTRFKMQCFIESIFILIHAEKNYTFVQNLGLRDLRMKTAIIVLYNKRSQIDARN